jgi:outer membrane protein assembly factor BamB
MLGGTPARNMVNPRDKLPPLPGTGPNWEKEGEARAWEAAFVLWKAELGSRAYGGPAVAAGKVFVGTNNERARNPRDTRVGFDGFQTLDKGVLMCFDATTGRFLWQAVHDKLPDGNVTDWPKEGLCSTPTVVGSRAYYVSNQCRVVCADVNGFADGNHGFRAEQYQDPDDADIVWEYDMRRELKVFPHNMSNCSPLVVGDRLFACTSNGVDEGHVNLPSPDAPSLVCLDRHTGKLLWSDNSPGKDVIHSQWSSPSYAREPVPQVLHAQGDGWLRAFDPATGKLLWKFDCNRKGATHELGGTGEKNDFVAMPAVYEGRVYIGTGQDPEHSAGLGNLWCIDLKKAVERGAKQKDRDVSPEVLVPAGETFVAKPNPASALAWVYGGPEPRPFAARDYKFCRTMSTAAVADGVVYAATLDGYLHCLDATTGAQFWQYDTKAAIWGSPVVVDGRVLLTTESGDLFVFRHAALPDTIDHMPPGPLNQAAARRFRKSAREQIERRYLLARIEFPATIRTTPVVAGGVLYVATENMLYAFGEK